MAVIIAFDSKLFALRPGQCSATNSDVRLFTYECKCGKRIFSWTLGWFINIEFFVYICCYRYRIKIHCYRSHWIPSQVSIYNYCILLNSIQKKNQIRKIWMKNYADMKILCSSYVIFNIVVMTGVSSQTMHVLLEIP